VVVSLLLVVGSVFVVTRALLSPACARGGCAPTSQTNPLLGTGAAPTTGKPLLTPAPTSGTAKPSKSPSASPTASSAKPSTSRPGGKPGPTNTGVPDGISLKVVNGDQTYSKDNQVISGLDIHGYVHITGDNVTIKNSIVRGGGKRCNASVIEIGDGASATIVDTEINPTNPNACLDGIWAQNATLQRLNIHGAVDGLKAGDNVTLLDSYVHDLSRFDSDPNQGGGPTHNDSVQTFFGNKHITLRHNNLLATSKDNATFQVSQDGGGRATDLHVEDNWLDGGGCTLNFAHQGGPTPMTGIFVVNNRFGRNSSFDCPILVSTQTKLTENSGNVFADNGKPIPAPQRHD
jgi:hypothetical protein